VLRTWVSACKSQAKVLWRPHSLAALWRLFVSFLLFEMQELHLYLRKLMSFLGTPAAPSGEPCQAIV
jgi:hypothetical protein